jgi:uncharacterized protein YcbX
MGELARISVSAVKGTALEHPSSADLTAKGIPANRRFHLIDARDELFSGFDFGPLVRVRASYDPEAESLAITFPDGLVVNGSADGSGPPVVTDISGRSVSGRIVEGAIGHAFSDYIGQDVRLVRTDHDGDGPDVHHLTLVSWASVRDLARRAGHEGDLDARRFRINLELEGCEPYEEDTWDGKRVAVGNAVLRLHGQIPRCIVTTQGPETGVKDFDTLHEIARYRPLIANPRGIPFGMYAEVEEPGTAAVGDAVIPLDP